MVKIDEALCTGCGKCVEDCVSMSLSLQEGKAAYSGACIHCGHCVAICPSYAVAIPEYDMEDVQERREMRKVISVDDLLHVIKLRRSTRQYHEKKVETEKWENILQAGRYTATAANLQSCKFVVIQAQLSTFKKMIWEDVAKAVAEGKEEAQPLQKLVELYHEEQIDYLFRDAPAVLCIAAENLWDAGLAAQNMELAAVTQGLGALYNGFLVRSIKLSPRVQEWMQLEGKPIAVALLIGYSTVDYKRTAPRKKANVVWL